MEYKKLKELCEISGGYAFKSSNFKNTGIPIIRIGDINNKKVNITDNTVYVDENIEEYKRFIVKKGDILIALSGATTGKFGVYNNDEDSLLNQRVAKLIPQKNILNKYLYHYMNVLQDTIYNKALGCAQPNISPSEIGELLVYLPNIEEQNKIVEVLDKAQELIDKRKEQIEALDQLVKSKFIEMFGTPNEKRFIGKILPEIIENDKYALKRGPFGGSLKKDDFIRDGYLVYEQRHAIHNDFEYAKYFISKEKYTEMIMFKVKPKDLLVSCSGVTLGRISEVPEGAKEGIINQALLKITLNQDIMNNIYFIQLFRNEQIQDKLFGFSRGSGIPNFPSMNEVKSMEFLCPPIELQNKFADFVKQVDKLKVDIEKSLKELEDNFNSLMQKAFNGYLFN